MTKTQDSVNINRERYQRLMEDAQAFSQIVFLVDTKATGDEFVDGTKDIIAEWRNSRYGATKE